MLNCAEFLALTWVHPIEDVCLRTLCESSTFAHTLCGSMILWLLASVSLAIMCQEEKGFSVHSVEKKKKSLPLAQWKLESCFPQSEFIVIDPYFTYWGGRGLLLYTSISKKSNNESVEWHSFYHMSLLASCVSSPSLCTSSGTNFTLLSFSLQLGIVQTNDLGTGSPSPENKNVPWHFYDPIIDRTPGWSS